MSVFKWIWVGIALIVFAAPVRCEDDTRRRLEASVRFLADDLLQGRGTPGTGLDIAALYLSNALRSAGWQPGNGESYLQTYTIREFSPKEMQYEISINGVRLDPQDYLFWPIGMDPDQTPVRFDLVFAGHGIVSYEKGINNLEGVDVRGKAVVSMLGAPWKLNPEVPFGPDRAVGKGIEAAVRNARFIIYATDELTVSTEKPASAEIALFREASETGQAFLPEFQGKPTAGLCPFLLISAAAFDKTLAGPSGRTYAEWQKVLSAGKQNRARALEASVEVRIQTMVREGRANNVVGILRGSDPALRDEWVVLTAHYDHLGTKEVAAGEDGIWNGADDNASGTATVLEIARQLAVGPAPNRSILALFTSGEERGLLGSAYYSRHPLVPYNRVIADMNVDMVGRSTGAVQAIVHGCPELFAKAVELGAQFGIQVLPDQQPSWRILYLSDHYHFARFGVPAVEFFTGLHPDYHQTSDSVDSIRYEEMGRIFRIMFGLTDYYAQGGKKLEFHRPEWFVTPDE